MKRTIWQQGDDLDSTPDWRERVHEIVRTKTPSSKEASGIHLFAEHLLAENWRDPDLRTAMLVTSVALWLTERIGMSLIGILGKEGAAAKYLLCRVTREWLAPDFSEAEVVSYDTPLREAVEEKLFEQDRLLYSRCHQLVESEVDLYINNPQLQDLAEISKAYNSSPASGEIGMERYCSLYSRGCRSQNGVIPKRVEELASLQRLRHFNDNKFDRFFLFFRGFNLYIRRQRSKGLKYLRRIVDMDGQDGPMDLPAQVAFHLIGNDLLQGGDKDLVNGLRLLKRSVKIAQHKGDPSAIAQTLTTLGRAHLKAGELVKAADALRDAASTAREFGTSSTALPLSLLAEAYLRLDKRRESLEAAREVLSLREASREDVARARFVLGQLG